MDKILEFCGWLIQEATKTGERFYFPPERKDFDYGRSQPDLDMNFFFKYVVPKLFTYDINPVGVFLALKSGQTGNSTNSDPNKAWQEALLKLMGELDEM